MFRDKKIVLKDKRMCIRLFEMDVHPLFDKFELMKLNISNDSLIPDDHLS